MRILARTAAVLLVLAVASCGSKTPTFTLKGDLTLTDPSSDWFGTEVCAGSGGFADIADGAQVVVTDRAGATIGIGKLGSGLSSDRVCVFPIAVDGVPAGKGFYGVQVTHRGVTQYSEDQARNGAVHLQLQST